MPNLIGLVCLRSSIPIHSARHPELVSGPHEIERGSQVNRDDAPLGCIKYFHTVMLRLLR